MGENGLKTAILAKRPFSPVNQAKKGENRG